jgi:hypothetical protein
VRRVNGSAVTLSWTAVPGARWYIVEAGYRPAMITPDFRFPVYSGTSFSDSPQNGTYYVRVRAENACEVGPASNEVTVVVPSP